MTYQIDELLKISKYDIYNNPDISEAEIKKLAGIISSDKSIDLKEYFQLLKCSSKFCWLNYLKILESLSEEDRIRGIPVLFELLQDSNWPTYQKTVELLEAMDRKMIQSYLNKYLKQAYAEGDEMWIFNMQLLQEKWIRLFY